MMDSEYWQLYKEFRENGMRPEDAIIKIHEIKLTNKYVEILGRSEEHWK